MLIEFRKSPYYIFFLSFLVFFSPAVASIFLFYEMSTTNKKVFYLMFSISLGMLAFYWQPQLRGDLYDLVRYHSIMNFVGSLSLTELVPYILTVFKPFLFMFLRFFSLFDNPNILQFFITSLGMYLLLDIIRFYSIKYSKKERTLLLFIVISTVRIIMVVSRLWNDLAIFIMTFAYFRVENKKMRIFLYIISVGIHFSMIIPLVIIIMNRSFKTKKIVDLVIPVLIISVTPYLFVPVVTMLHHLTNLELFSVLIGRYNAYVVNQADFANIHDLRLYLLELSKPLFVLFGVGINYYVTRYKKEFQSEYNLTDIGFTESILMSTIIIVMGTKIRILTRFSTMVIILFIPYFVPFIKNIVRYTNKMNTNFKYVFMFLLCSFIAINLYFQINSLYHAHFFDSLIFVFN